MRPPIRLLGSVEVEVAGRPGELGPARQRAVLAVLLLAAGHPVQSDELLSRVWGFDSPPAARQALRTYVCRLRQAVRGSGLQIDRASGGYVAVVDPERLDLSRFRRLVADARAAGRAGNSDGALAGLTEALGLWPGSALAGVHSPWLDDVRTALAEEHLCVELDHNELALQRGQHAQLLPTLTAHVAEEPFDERLTGQLMLALQASGRASDALATYERMRRRLRDELGTEPARALREVHQQVLRAEDGPGSQSAGTRPGRPVPHQLPAALVGFVNRRSEWRSLDLALTSANDGTSPRFAVLAGTGGVGKTTLAVRWAREHAAAFPDGQLFVDLQGFDPRREPMSPESALHTFLLALGADPAALPSDLNALTGMYRSALDGRRVLVVADNARTSDQVRPLLPPGPASAALVTSRSWLAGVLADHGVQVIPVGMLDGPDARALIGKRLGAERVAREAASVDRLVGHCAGLPLALAIVAGRAAMTPRLQLAVLVTELDDDTTRLDGLCSGEAGSDVRATLDASVSVLPAPAQAAFGLMGLAPGPSVSARGFTALSGLIGPVATAALRDLTSTHLVTQERPGRYRMHDLVRLYAAGLGRSDPQAGTAVRRLLLHYLDGADTSTGGPDFVSIEAPSMIAAVDLAIREGYDDLGCDLAVALEAHLSSRGCWRDLVRVSTSAAAAARRRDDPQRLVRALVGLGRGKIGLRQFDGAAIDLERAIQIAGDLPASGLLAAVHRALARLAAKQNRHDQALPHDVRAFELYLATADLTGQATAYNAIGWHQAHLGEPESGLENCSKALAIFDETGNCSGQAMTLDSVGFALALLGRHAEAQDCYLRSERLAAQLGSQVARADTLRRLAHSYRRTGRPAEARSADREAAEALRLTGRLETDPRRGETTVDRVIGDTFRAAVGITAS